MVEISTVEEGQAEYFVEGPHGGQGNEEEAHGPEQAKVLQVVGYARFQSEVEDEVEKTEKTTRQERRERECGYVEGRIGDWNCAPIIVADWGQRWG